MCVCGGGGSWPTSQHTREGGGGGGGQMGRMAHNQRGGKGVSGNTGHLLVQNPMSEDGVGGSLLICNPALIQQKFSSIGGKRALSNE